jgi:hypothetical protein
MSIPSTPLRYAGVWNATTLYYIDNLVISPINNKAYVLVVPSLTGGTDPSITSANWVLADTTPFGTYKEETGGNTTVVITIPNLTDTGTVSICYVHAGGGGGTQYIKSITNTANTCTIVCNTAVDISDQIIWQVLSLS